MVLPKLQKLLLQSLSCLILVVTPYSYARITEGTEGILDISHVDLTSYGDVDITGTWAFFPNEFIDPMTSASATQFLGSGNVWGENNTLPQYGYGSYRM
ncbi:MAG: hypothetical protein AAF267_24250, partial [Deinococcota bacterium]